MAQRVTADVWVPQAFQFTRDFLCLTERGRSTDTEREEKTQSKEAQIT